MPNTVERVKAAQHFQLSSSNHATCTNRLAGFSPEHDLAREKSLFFSMIYGSSVMNIRMEKLHYAFHEEIYSCKMMVTQRLNFNKITCYHKNFYDFRIYSE